MNHFLDVWPNRVPLLILLASTIAVFGVIPSLEGFSIIAKPADGPLPVLVMAIATLPDLTPLDMVKHLMEEISLNVSDLGRILGEQTPGPKILNGTRELSKAHIRKLADHFGVSADLFI